MKREIYELMKFDELENLRTYLNTLTYFLEKEKENIDSKHYNSAYIFLKNWSGTINDITNTYFYRMVHDDTINLICKKYWKDIMDSTISNANEN